MWGIAIFAAAEGALVLLAGLAGIENISVSHHVDEHGLTARIANDAAERAEDIWVHWANRTNRADGGWLGAVPKRNQSGEATLNHLNENQIGAVEAKLRSSCLAVVDFARHGWATQRARLSAALEILHAGERCRHVDRGRLRLCGWAVGWAGACRERERSDSQERKGFDLSCDGTLDHEVSL